jgi:hypothetical protein
MLDASRFDRWPHDLSISRGAYLLVMSKKALKQSEDEMISE